MLIYKEIAPVHLILQLYSAEVILHTFIFFMRKYKTEYVGSEENKVRLKTKNFTSPQLCFIQRPADQAHVYELKDDNCCVLNEESQFECQNISIH